MLYLDLENISNSVNAVRMSHDEVAANCVAAQKCKMYLPPGENRFLHADEYATLPRATPTATKDESAGSAAVAKPATLVAHNLETCAAVVLSGPSGFAMYHAGSGVIAEDTITKVSAKIGKISELKIIYAIPRAVDTNYELALKKLISMGVNTNNLIVLVNVGRSFCVNEQGLVGEL